MAGQKCVTRVQDFFHPYLLPLKALFFFQIGASACVIPFLPLYLRHLGLSAAETGVIYGVLPFTGILSKPIAGILMDKLHRPRAVIRIFTVIQLVFMGSIYFIPKMVDLFPTVTMYNMPCADAAEFNRNGSWNLSCNTLQPDPAEIIPANYAFPPLRSPDGNLSLCNCTALDSPATTEPAIVRWTLQFWLTGLLLVFAWMGYLGIFTVDDSIAFPIVENSPVTTSYGANRVFGTIGYACFALLVGLLLDGFWATQAVTQDFAPAFGTFAAAVVCGLIVTFFLRPSSMTEGPKTDLPSTKTAATMWDLLTVEVVLFGLGAFSIGISTGVLYGFLGLYQEELGASKLLVGLTIFVQCAYEAPMMACSGWVIRKLGFHVCMILALFSFGLRFVAYYLLTNTWLFLATEATHALGFGLFYANMASFAFKHAPVGLSATLLGVLGTLYEGLGQGIGGIAAGFLYERYGGPNTFLGFGSASAGAAVLYTGVQVFIKFRRPSS